MGLRASWDIGGKVPERLRQRETEILRLWHGGKKRRPHRIQAIADELNVTTDQVRHVLTAHSRRVETERARMRRRWPWVLAVWEAHNMGVSAAEICRLFNLNRDGYQDQKTVAWIIGLDVHDPDFCLRTFGFSDPWLKAKAA